MGKELNRMRSRKEARGRLDRINERRDMTLVIHYSCESFYDIKDGRTPRVTSIAVRNFASGQTASFSIHKSAEQRGIDVGKIEAHYDALEKDMLDEYFVYLKTVPTQTFVHWNMRDVNYGFQAIEHRYKVLKGTPVVVENTRKIDLARELVALFGKGYAPHGEYGRMHSLMEINSITRKDALTGAEEAEAFDVGEFVKLHQSTLRKVDVIANILDRTLDGSLKTIATFRERVGFHPAALLELITEHWVWSAVVVVAVVLGIVATIFGFF